MGLAVVLVAALSTTSCRLFFPGLVLLIDLGNAVSAAPEGEKLCALWGVLAVQPNSRGLTDLLNQLASAAELPVTFTPERAAEIIARSAELVLVCQRLDCVESALAEFGAPTDNAEVETWVTDNADALGLLCPPPLDPPDLTALLLLKNALGI